jgi:type III restriction/modification enzyme restriction subunit/helicase-like protein/intein-like protein with splicing domain
VRPVVSVTLTNLKAWITDCDDVTYERLRDFWSYFSPGARWAPAYKLWLKEKARALRRGEPNAKVVGWDGKIRLFQRGSVSAGLFRATRKEAEETLKIRFKIEYKRSLVYYIPVRDEVQSKYRYQAECVHKMQRAIRRGGGIVLSATGCLSGDTAVDIPRDLVKYPRGVPIKELVGQRPLVYCYDEEAQKITFSRATSVHRSGVQVPVWRVHFSSGSRYTKFCSTFLEATCGHLVMLRNGSYKRVDQLVVGDRLMPLYRKLGDSEYAQLDLNNGEKVLEHRFILSCLYGPRSLEYHGHHKNGKKQNNNCKNLEWKSGPVHASDHAKAMHKQGKFLGWVATGIHPRGMAGKPQTVHQRAVASKTAKAKLLRHKWLRKDLLLALYIGKRLTTTEIAKRFGVGARLVRQIAAKYGMVYHRVRKAIKYFRLTKRNNHVVTKIEYVGCKDVYDITVPIHHNFVANGIVVHNSGKTKCAADFYKSVPDYSCLFVVDQIDLLYQSQKEIESWLKEPVGVVGDLKYKVQRVTVATIQTLHRHMEDEKFEKWFRGVKIVVVDELHEQMAKRNFSLLEKIKPIARYGLTATLQLSQKPVRMKAYSFAGPVIYRFPISKGQALGVLSKGEVVQLLFPAIDDPNEDQVDWNADERLEYEVLTNNLKLYACYQIVKALVDAGRYVIVLADRVAHVQAISEQLEDIPHRVAYGEIKAKKRLKARKKFERGDIRLIVASRVFKKGLNMKRVDVIIDMAEKANKNDAMQKFGRGVRLHPDKHGLLYIDFGTQFGKFGTAAKSRARVLKAAGIPLVKIKVNGPVQAKKAVLRVLKRQKKDG